MSGCSSGRSPAFPGLAPLDPRARPGAPIGIRVHPRAFGIKLVKVPAANAIILVGPRRPGALAAPRLGCRDAQARRSRARPPRAGPSVESRGRGPRPADGSRHSPARGHRGGLRADRARQARAVADLPGRRPRSSRPAQTNSRTSASSSGRPRASTSGWDSDGKRVGDARHEPRRAAGRRVSSSGTASPPSASALPDGVYLPVVKLERSHRTIVAPERHQGRHDAAADRRASGTEVPDHLAGRRRPRGRLPRSLRGQRAGARDPAPARQAGRVHERPEGERRRSSGTARCRARRARSRRPVRADDRGARPRRQPVDAACPSRSRRCGTSRSARTRVVVRPGGRFALRVSTDAPTGRLAAPRPLTGRSRAGTLHLRAPKTRGRLPPVRLGRKSLRDVRRGGRMSAERRTARAAPSARSGSALLIVGHAPRLRARRPRRVGGRLRRARGVPRTARAPPRARGCGGARRWSRPPPARALVAPRAVAARARDARLRAGADPRPRRLDAGEPAAAALRRRRRRGDRARVGALRRRRPRRASSGRSRGRSRSSSRGRALRSSGRRTCGRARSSCSSSCCRSACSPSRSRACRGRARWVLTLYVQLAAMALVFAVDRDRPVRDAQHLLEPEGARRQRLRTERLVLPRQLGLLRPVDLRTLPRRRDPREPRRRALPAARDPLWRIAARAHDRDHVGRAAARRSRSRASSR